jgi:hypothetical protein
MNSVAHTGTGERIPAMTFRAASFLPAISGLAFLCTCLAFHALLSAPNVPGNSPKMQFFAAHKDEFDTIFVGSSRIYSGISPSTFDQIMASAGSPSHAFNFGVNGMYPPETFYVLEQILSLKPRKLKRVFVEMDDVQVTWLPDEQTSQRVLYWHDWKRTGVILQKMLNLDVHEHWTRKLRTVRRWRGTILLHLALFAKNFSNFGRALDLAESLVGDNQIEFGELGPKLDGYFPQAARISGEKLADFEQELARQQAAQIGTVALDHYADQAYRHFAHQIRSAGATPVFVVPPIYPQRPSTFRGPSPGLLLAYNNSTLYSDLYRPEARNNEGHLNSTGAEKFTRLLAEDFLRNMRQP